MTGRRATLPLYLGGFLGPFGGAVLAVLIPELRDAFHATTDQVALAVPAYLVPFALLQVVSGTIGERIGRRRAVRAAYLVYAVALLLAAVAPTIGIFLVSRALQGTANAFTTPLLLAGLADAVPAGERGRAVGMFAGVQAGGLSLAPLLGGLAAEGSWRLAFILPALVSLGLMLMPPPDPIRAVGEQLPTLRSVATPRMGLLCAAGFAGYLGMAGLAFLISLRADDAFALGATGRGAVLAVYGAAGLLFGRRGRARLGAAGPGQGGGAGGDRLRRHDRAARHRSVGGGDGAAVVRGGRDVGAAVGGPEHDRRRGRAGKPRRRRVAVRRVQVLRHGGGAAGVAAGLRRLAGPGIPGRRDRAAGDRAAGAMVDARALVRG